MRRLLSPTGTSSPSNGSIQGEIGDSLGHVQGRQEHDEHLVLVDLRGDFCVETDARVGQVLDALDAKGMAEDTLVIFTSDNGCSRDPAQCDDPEKRYGHRASHIYRGYKSDMWDGGHRVPFLWRLYRCPGSGGWTYNDAEARADGLPELQLYHMGEDPAESDNTRPTTPS